MINFMTAKKTDFKSLPRIDELREIDRAFDSLIIIPEPQKHDSGFMCMSVAGYKDDKAVCIMGGGSDVIHFDGIGGYGNEWRKMGEKLPDKIPPKAWSVDCLPCGYLRIFAPKSKITIGSMLSSFEIYAEERRKKK